MSQRREVFQVKRAGAMQEISRGDHRRGGPMVGVSRELAIGGLLLVLLLLVAGGLWWLGRNRGKTGSGEEASAGGRASEEALIVWQGPHPAEVAENFTKAASHAERLKWVRQPEKVGAEMEAFFRDGPGATEKIMGKFLLATSGQDDLLYENYHVSIESGESRLLCVSVDPQGAKVDFEAYARSGSEKWSELAAGTVPSAEEMRVIVQSGGFYMHRFPDQTKWVHFKATTPDLPGSMDLYVLRDSEAARQLAQVGETMARVTVSIRAVEDSAKYRQFEITAIRAIGWVEAAE
jgi:hypothetical protein